MLSPLTNRSNCSLLKIIDGSEISARWLEELSIDWKPCPSIKEIKYWKDNETGLYFYSPSVAAGGKDLYAQLQRLPWYYMEEKWEFSQAIRIIKKYAPAPGASLLEIGVGKGAFLRKARQASIEVSGIEFNPSGAAAARQEGFTIFEEDLEYLCTMRTTGWDCLCAFQVLEHLPDPKGFLENALSLLKPGGILILSVPNAEVAQGLDPDRVSLLDQPPHHMTHWNEGVFRILETIFPIRLVEIAFEPLASYHIDWFLGAWSMQLGRVAGRKTQRLVFNRYSTPVIRACLAAGARKLIRGHTLLVCLQKRL